MELAFFIGAITGGYVMKPADVISMLKDQEVKFVDLRFVDTKGKEQHVTIPARDVDEGFFEDGKSTNPT
jgi:glutamine synthetase